MYCRTLTASKARSIEQELQNYKHNQRQGWEVPRRSCIKSALTMWTTAETPDVCYIKITQQIITVKGQQHRTWLSSLQPMNSDDSWKRVCCIHLQWYAYIKYTGHIIAMLAAKWLLWQGDLPTYLAETLPHLNTIMYPNNCTTLPVTSLWTWI